MNSEGVREAAARPGRGSERGRGVGPPARGGRGGGGGEGLPQSSRGPRAAPFTEDSGHQGLKRTSRVPAPRGPSAQGPPGGAVLGPGPSQHQWLQGRVRLRLTPAPTLQAAGAQATRVHTAHPRPRDRLRPPGVTITADRGLQSRRPRPLALHLRQSTQGLGLGPAGRRRLLGVLPVHAGGTREPGADGAVGTGACNRAEETVERNAECA